MHHESIALKNSRHHPNLPRQQPGTEKSAEYSSTISRYSCRLLVDRSSGRINVFAAGFDSHDDIFLGEKATKWQKPNGEWDGLTTNGILLLHPHMDDDFEANADESGKFVWQEVSVDGDVYSLRTTRASPTRGQRVDKATNVLQVGNSRETERQQS